MTTANVAQASTVAMLGANTLTGNIGVNIAGGAGNLQHNGVARRLVATARHAGSAGKAACAPFPPGPMMLDSDTSLSAGPFVTLPPPTVPAEFVMRPLVYLSRTPDAALVAHLSVRLADPGLPFRAGHRPAPGAERHQRQHWSISTPSRCASRGSAGSP
ncbi:MAG: hypothetical protein VB142_10190 [Burkholderia sp.]